MPRRRQRLIAARARLPLAIALVASLVGCQPVDDVAIPPPGGTPAPAGQSPLGAPVTGMPDDLGGLLQRTADPALQWQDEPRVAEIVVALTEGGRWRQARVTYLAADADRLLTVTVDRDGLSMERATLATLDLHAVTGRALGALPELPDDVLAPEELARRGRAFLRRCGVAGRIDSVRYASGAPVTWNGRRWTEQPVWRATLATGTGAVTVDPSTATLIACVPPT